VVINIGLGEALDNPKALDAAVSDLAADHRPETRDPKARVSIAAFKLREGRAIGAKVTLRGERMWAFLDRLMNIVLPRVRDFRGVSRDAFDGRGNYTLGLREQLIFPEIEYDKIDKVRGMEITIVTSAQNDEQAARLLEMFGMPFRKE
jgi:large subunit ribosomal protein L5